MQEIKVISGTPTAQLTALAKLQCIMIQSLEKSNPQCAHKNVCACIHTWQIQRHTHLYICILYSSSIGWITIIIIIIIVLASELFNPVNGNEHEQRAAFKLFRRAWSAPSGPKCPF